MQHREARARANALADELTALAAYIDPSYAHDCAESGNTNPGPAGEAGRELVSLMNGLAPEAIATEACVNYQEGAHVRASTPMTLEECVRLECGFRLLEWTPELQAFVDRCYLAWYLEP